VNWATDQSATTGSLQWGPVSGGTCTLSNTMTAARNASLITVGTVKEYQWKAALTRPAQGSYCSRPLLAGTDSNPSPAFTTQAAAGSTAPFTFDVFGDCGHGGRQRGQPGSGKPVLPGRSQRRQVRGDRRRQRIPVGQPDQLRRLQQTGGSTSAIVGPSFWTVAGSSVPLFTAVGNHGLSGTSHTDITTWTQDLAVSSSNGSYANGTYNCCSGSTSVYTGATNNITSVTDAAGNPWTRIGAFSVSGHNSDGEMWYSPNAASTTAVTVHLGTVVNTAVEVQEFAGVATASPLDTSAGLSNTSAAANSGPITPAAGNELLVGFVAGHGNAEAMTVNAPGSTAQPQQTTGASVASVVTGSRVLSSPFAQAFSATFPTAMYWASGIAAVKAAS